MPRGGGGSTAKANRGRPHNGLQLAKMRQKMIPKLFLQHIGTNYSHRVERQHDFGGFSEPSYQKLEFHHPLRSFVSVVSAEVKSEP